ncbi:hypothetical protein LAZ67_3004399 [Cordylochernes scorpioides]|uniref:Uncharacterized protein n=1 Tax=Cordylochernes scorpioides TaxID=51811 RepID=A0ABY6K995_9ARAC|nr:hypothetical protein LAZ67_3004399 [Cordylochernes scorpioides]
MTAAEVWDPVQAATLNADKHQRLLEFQSNCVKFVDDMAASCAYRLNDIPSGQFSMLNNVNSNQRSVRRNRICHSIIHDDLSLKRLSCKFVPRTLTLEQKEALKEMICERLLKLSVQNQMCQHKEITGYETWVYDPGTKRKSSQWLVDDKPRSKKTRM